MFARPFLSEEEITELLFTGCSTREKRQLFAWTNMTAGVRSPDWLIIVVVENYIAVILQAQTTVFSILHERREKLSERHEVFEICLPVYACSRPS